MTGFTLDRHRYTAKPCPRCATPCITHGWCATCGRSVDTRGETMPQTPSDHLDLARAILADHARGLHAEYETENGCLYSGCSEAFWAFAKAQESEPEQE